MNNINDTNKVYNSVTIISDIHIGAGTCNADAVLKVLDELDTELLVINGDLFDAFNVRLNRSQWKILSKLRKLSDEMDIVWVTGNHDEQEPHPEFIGSLIGIKVFNEFRFIFNDYTVICIHGHIWDEFISKYPRITNIADWIYGIFQRIDKSHRIARWLKGVSKTFLRNKERIKNKALRYCDEQLADVIVCGHTHFAERLDSTTCRYINSGCFTDSPATYVKNLHIYTVDEV